MQVWMRRGVVKVFPDASLILENTLDHIKFMKNVIDSSKTVSWLVESAKKQSIRITCILVEFLVTLLDDAGLIYSHCLSSRSKKKRRFHEWERTIRLISPEKASS